MKAQMIVVALLASVAAAPASLADEPVLPSPETQRLLDQLRARGEAQTQEHALAQARLAECPKPAPQIASDPGPRTAPRKLGEMPPGRQMKAVMLSVDGCQMMVVKVGEAWAIEPAPAMQTQPLK